MGVGERGYTLIRGNLSLMLESRFVAGVDNELFDCYQEGENKIDVFFEGLVNHMNTI